MNTTLAEHRKKISKIIDILPDSALPELVLFLEYMQYKFDSSSISFAESTSEPSSDFTLPKILLKLANIPDAELKLELALLLFKQEKITLGTASQIAGLNQLEFQSHLGRRQISIHYGIDDFRQDLKTLETELSE